MKETACPLCRGHDQSFFSRDSVRDYYHCAACSLVYVLSGQFLSIEDEKKRYDLHRNSAEDHGYRAYLNRLLNPMLDRLAPASCGLDFGSGAAAVLADLFRNAGHTMTTYDLFYRPDDRVFEHRYDYITASEVVEHLRCPARELDRLWRCLKPGSILGIMTQWIAPAEAFSKWHYRNDPTHICFYSPKTFTWLAQQWGAEVVFPERDVALLLKADHPTRQK